MRARCPSRGGGSELLDTLHRRFRLKRLPAVEAAGWVTGVCVWHFGLCSNSDTNREGYAQVPVYIYIYIYIYILLIYIYIYHF